MTLSVKLTIPELELLTTLASDQLFRREFIDPKMPGHRPNSGEISMGKALISRLRILRDGGVVKGKPAAAGASSRMAG